MSFCHYCLKTHMETDPADALDKNWTCWRCNNKCCCLFSSCDSDHRHCYTYRRTQKRHSESGRLRWSKEKLPNRSDSCEGHDEAKDTKKRITQRQKKQSNKETTKKESGKSLKESSKRETKKERTRSQGSVSEELKSSEKKPRKRSRSTEDEPLFSGREEFLTTPTMVTRKRSAKLRSSAETAGLSEGGREEEPRPKEPAPAEPEKISDIVSEEKTETLDPLPDFIEETELLEDLIPDFEVKTESLFQFSSPTCPYDPHAPPMDFSAFSPAFFPELWATERRSATFIKFV
eukprot:TRINITY_DN2725_c0_g1_i1.p1 TRINITY_DN2725_c0_g1~~TRINITY_DN2725_c0_g1_i1.p1  ORF type:complete len:290 (-),score=49.29 TRINITY_DN2725_c0_g1_i1:119-988(-)